MIRRQTLLARLPLACTAQSLVKSGMARACSKKTKANALRSQCLSRNSAASEKALRRARRPCSLGVNPEPRMGSL